MHNIRYVIKLNEQHTLCIIRFMACEFETIFSENVLSIYKWETATRRLEWLSNVQSTVIAMVLNV